ncbi:bifunctional [glutamine synthetase] adenylyltransferase/[glutamine synthetase]-adenylyl-L-tyrosine phosphorylase [Demequina muriae]|uniref:Bifunctional [glutamine synthetase] adenylyltransferase/[glutamine synthetase]-adenylyl-L-tyrosine phosphorylase n=1 Tax=Demequina muriae TaxID=3051664 RepID=A0ABT8GJS0_9MICO|nr:bifunctional [glutamine synthetase] adenylyltransferase/[glutamine synthetase]-adenylyl-L-tyrosine phosphorylase [Demequina sp. EGI L300058]MDN4481521.1 bifunctional [glutamine synthetase] adenylyltransferase/[glutamine synthetase]-adenylyl-L-tyrosine phosphorylase [Demequina sp. EGI L300058]
MSTREISFATRLRRAGVADATRAERMIDQIRDIAGVDIDDPALAVSYLADPDTGLLQLLRLAESARDAGLIDELAALSETRAGGYLAVLLGGSVALGDFLVRHPEFIRDFSQWPEDQSFAEVDSRRVMLESVGADPDAAVPVATVGGEQGVAAMRVAYRRLLIRIAAEDLYAKSPPSLFPQVGSALADLAGAALEAGLAIARAGEPDHAATRLTIIGMGKCGGRELNYISDVDVIYVAEPAEGIDEQRSLKVATKLATVASRACDRAGAEPALWEVDANLRPEGKDGALVRGVAGHRAYYERWASTWEFQALLKARPIAGDPEVGQAYLDAVTPMVWKAVEREGFVQSAQAMRRRVEDHVPPQEADRQLKLGPGGLRDVEFTIQLLQLVHGRHDTSLRSRTTLTALEALRKGGYVGRPDAAKMERSYRQLRVWEHRIQLRRMQRTHLMPADEDSLRILARASGYATVEYMEEVWHDIRRDVRAMHLEMFYRPILPLVASMSADEARLDEGAARDRLAAVGFDDPQAALRHITALTDGVSRRAAIQRQLMPAMIGWFAQGADPDAGLLAFRKLSEQLTDAQWYLKLLRDSGTAAERLARLLSTSRYVTAALLLSAESVTWLGDDAELKPRDRDRMWREADAILKRSDDPEQSVTAMRGLRRRELARTAAADVLGLVDSVEAARSVTAAADVLIGGALRIARTIVARDEGDEAHRLPMIVVAMGRYGGNEMGYKSDADVQFVFDGSEPGAQELAVKIARTIQRILTQVGSQPPLEIDAALRPEGRNGPLARSLSSTAEYYGRWSDPWEAQALLRARPCAGDAELIDAFTALIDKVRYPADLPASALKQMRTLKARMEAERLPRGVDPRRHLKLGPGGLADVEWTVQLLQLQHAHDHPELRTTMTIDALHAASEAGLIDGDDAATLEEAWVLATALRGALALRGRDRSADVLPGDARDLKELAEIMNVEDTGAELQDRYGRATRHARAVTERVFFGWDSGA